MTLRLVLFDDPTARRWEPFAATRPVGELLFGALLLRERIEGSLGVAAEGYLSTEGIEAYSEQGSPSIVSAEAFGGDHPVVLLSSRYVPPLDRSRRIRVGPDGADAGAGAPRRLVVAGDPVGWIMPGGADREALVRGLGADPVRSLLSPGGPNSETSEAIELPGKILTSPWDLVDRNADQLARDIPVVFAPGTSELPGGEEGDVRRLLDLPGVHRIGNAPVTCEDGVEVDPGVVLDTRSGPIHFRRGVGVRPFTHLRGPAVIGAGTTLLGGVFEGLSCGPVCKLRGEIEASVILGYTNKAHDGYIGHSMLGRWVNLGAFTTNSDLKNNYGSIRVGGSTGEIDTGLLKVGVFLGDHVKTGIGTLMNAGTVVGAGTNLFGGRMPPKLVPPFSWGTGVELGIHRKDAFLATAERAMGRRGVGLTPAHRVFLSGLWNRIQGEDPGGSSE